ncbi:MAG: type IV toxin-antitoxin system AbiEi family antitoxin domain-containing protein [Acidimicrobiia bacterium]
MDSEYTLLPVAASQAGYFTLQQALAAGFTPAMVRHRLQSERWLHVHHGLYRIQSLGDDYVGRLRAAVVALPGAVVSHQAAGVLHGFPYLEKDLACVTVHSSTTHCFPEVVVHRTRDLADHHRTVIDLLPVTTVARTVVDLAAVCHIKLVAVILDELLVQRRLQPDALNRVFHEVARRGKPGSGPLRELLVERLSDDLIHATKLERLGRDLFRSGGLPVPVWQYPAPWNDHERIDCAWPSCAVGCEFDGRRWHTRAADFERDRRRDRQAILHGWRILRFTWEDLTRRPEEVLRQVRSALCMPNRGL